MTAKEIRALAARIAVLDAFDTHRARGRFDMTASRRRRAIMRLEDELRRARRERDLDLMLKPGERDGISLEPTREDLAAAMELEATARIGRSVSSDVVVALEETRKTLELERPRKLARALNGDRGIEVYRTGNSR